MRWYFLQCIVIESQVVDSHLGGLILDVLDAVTLVDALVVGAVQLGLHWE